MKDIRVVVVDDQRLVRSGFCTMLSVKPGIEVVGQAGNGLEAVEVAAAVRPDVVLMDVRMPVLNGVAATQRIRNEVPGTQVLLLSTFDDDEYVLTGLKAGAVGYLLKDIEDDDLMRAIHAAAQGKATLDPAVTGKVIAGLTRVPQSTFDAISTITNPLSERELAALRLVANGTNNRAIAGTLSMAEGSVRNLVTTIMDKLGAHDRAHAVGIAKDLGII